MINTKSDNIAVSQIVSFLLVIGLVVSMISVIVLWGMPFIEEKNSENEMQTTYYSFEVIDNTVKDLLYEGNNSKRVIGVVCPNDRGLLSVKTSIDNKLIIMYTYNNDYDFSITNLEEAGVNDPNFDISMTNSVTFNDAMIYYLDSTLNMPYVTDKCYIKPDDVDDNNRIDDFGGATISASKNLEGNLLIDFFDDIDIDLAPLARIWVFELGSINYKAGYSVGTQRTVFENGAILTNGVENKGMINNPALIISNDKSSVALRVLQLNALGRNSIIGRSNPNVMLNLVNSYRREKPTEYLIDTWGTEGHVSNLKFQFHGENKQDWIDYFASMDEFDIIDSDTVEYYQNPINFILDSSFINVDVGV